MRAWYSFCSYVLSEASHIRKWLIHYSVCTAYRDMRQIAWAPEISIREKITYQWHLQSQSELYRISWWYLALVIDLITLIRQLGCDGIKLWCYWL